MASPEGSLQFSGEYLNEYNGSTLLAICGLFIALDTISVGLRYYARHLTTTGFGWDDAIIPVAWLVNVGLCVLGICAVKFAGVGRHLAYVLQFQPQQVENWGKSLYALEWLYLTAVALPKIAILLFYLRFLTRRDARITCYIVLTFVIATWFAYVIASNLLCRPFEFQWDKNIPGGGECFNIEGYYKSSSVPNILTDLVIIVLPIPTVVNLKTTLVRKAGLLFVFMIGSIGLIGSCIRMSTFFTHDALTDNTWESVPLIGWSIIEPAMYLIAACLMTLRPLLRKILPTNLTSRLQNSMAFRKPQNSGSSNFHDMRGRHERPLNDSCIELHQERDFRSSSEGLARPTPVAWRQMKIPRKDVERRQVMSPDSHLAVLDS